MFEFDADKSAANLAKHGIDFIEAQALWADDRLTEIAAVDYGGEERRLYVGEWRGKRWTAVVTKPGEHIRLISVPRARPSEEIAYDRAGI